MWDALLEAGKDFGIRPCGLGARNTLRLEAGMSLYGHEISEEINVFEAGLDRFLKFDRWLRPAEGEPILVKGEFIGRDALLAVQQSGGPKRKIVGLEMLDRGIARDGYSVHSLSRNRIGTVTSGSPAPFLKTNIAMALVPATVAASGVDVIVECRANKVRARQVPLPFYKRPKKRTVGRGLIPDTIRSPTLTSGAPPHLRVPHPRDVSVFVARVGLLYPQLRVPNFGCPTLGAPLFLRLGWEGFTPAAGQAPSAPDSARGVSDPPVSPPSTSTRPGRPPALRSCNVESLTLSTLLAARRCHELPDCDGCSAASQLFRS